MSARYANFRDVATASPMLRQGVVFRADAPLGDERPATAAVWPPEVVLDLRDLNERQAVHPLQHASAVHSIPVLADASPVQVSGYKTLGDLYEFMLVGTAAAAISQVVDRVAEASGPALIHCMAGKDRTGVSVALLLTLAGVPREDVVRDYVATAANMPGVIHNMMTSLAGAHAVANPDYDPATIPAHVLEAPAHAIERVLDIWDGIDGGAEEWLVSVGGSAASAARVRQRLLA